MLFAGDIAFIGSTPLVWEGSLLNWIETVGRIIALKPRVIVPGHGPVTDVEGLRSMEAYLGHVVAQGAELKERGPHAAAGGARDRHRRLRRRGPTPSASSST